jgi:N6-L-threonylcarbamoyladenine synthase
MSYYILGIETSCDETSAAIINEGQVLANIVSSQEIHNLFGGVVPELASRAHIRLITLIVQRALTEAGLTTADLKGIAVTHGPGLIGALLVGLSFTKGLSSALHIPFIGINHIEGHLYSNFLTNPAITFPHLSLVVSGGHTQLVLMREHLHYEIIGKTRDDAVGEAFDKGAKVLGLGYPGGPLIDKLALGGNDDFHRFPRAYLKNNSYDFSYSGLKTSLLVYSQSKDGKYIREHLAHVCASYQKAAVEVLIKKTSCAAIQYKVRSIGIVGGVAANSLLRAWMAKEADRIDKSFFIPEMDYCTDNAAMIARAGFERLKRGMFSTNVLNAAASLPLATAGET